MWFIRNRVIGNTGTEGLYCLGLSILKMSNRFESSAVIIDDKDVLRDDWQPNELVEREEELDEYAASLQPVIEGWQPSNVFIYGVTGAGKTAATRELMNELYGVAENTEDVSLDVVEVNCTSLNSSYQVAVNLVNEFRSPSHQLTSVTALDKPTLSETGYPQKRVFNELYEDIESIGGTVLFVLDEIDNIGTDDDVLYELPRARTTHDIDAKIGVIGISNDFKFRDNLSPKVKDTLCEEEILFAPYDAHSLRSILNRRVERAFVDPDAVTDDVLPLCAALATQDSGSARQALQLLRKSAELAEKSIRNGKRDENCIREDDVRDANQSIQRQQVIEGMHELTQHGQFVLLTLCKITAEDEAPARTKSIHRRYQSVVEEFDTTPLKRRRVHDHLSDLNLHGILELIEESHGRGNYNLYSLDVSLNSALEALENDFDSETMGPVWRQAEANDVMLD